jgi:catechol 2,3-dioxygenase-like lactoylglutathione lyase family enzyme
MTTPRFTLSGIVLDCPDPRALAAFYQALLGWPEVSGPDDPTWVKIRPDGADTGLSFQLEERYVPPVWPATAPDHQQMQVHLDIWVDDLDASSAFAQQHGATVAAFQPQDDVRVHLDPAGHPFCLFLN